VLDGIYIEKLYEAIEIFQSYLLNTVPEKVFQQAKLNCAFFALETAKSLLNRGDRPRALAQIQAALKYSFSFRVIRSAGRIILLDGTKSLLRTIVMGKKSNINNAVASLKT
jgi:hypothetical protein